MQDAFVQVMNRIPSHALSVFIYLEQRAKMDTKVGLTQQELSRATGLSVGKVREALGWLEEPHYKDSWLLTERDLGGFITVTKFSKAYKITLLEPYVENACWIRFTFDDTDDRRIGVLEEELRRLSKSSPQKTRLSLVMQGAKQQLIAEIENDLGRPLQVEDAYLLGGIVESFGPERVKVAWRKFAPQLDQPFRGLFAMFMKERFGPPTPMPERKDVFSYDKIVRDEELL